MVDEEWRPVLGFDGFYSVSNMGRVRSEDRVIPVGIQLRRQPGRVLRQQLTRGVFMVGLWQENKPEFHQVHTLVMEAFVGPRPRGCVTGHKDRDRTNNRLDNLEWISEDECMDRRIEAGVGRGLAKISEEDVREIRRRYEVGQTQAQIADSYGLQSPSSISHIVSGRCWSRVTS